MVTSVFVICNVWDIFSVANERDIFVWYFCHFVKWWVCSLNSKVNLNKYDDVIIFRYQTGRAVAAYEKVKENARRNIRSKH